MYMSWKYVSIEIHQLLLKKQNFADIVKAALEFINLLFQQRMLKSLAL